MGNGDQILLTEAFIFWKCLIMWKKQAWTETPIEGFPFVKNNCTGQCFTTGWAHRGQCSGDPGEHDPSELIDEFGTLTISSQFWRHGWWRTKGIRKSWVHIQRDAEVKCFVAGSESLKVAPKGHFMKLWKKKWSLSCKSDPQILQMLDHEMSANEDCRYDVDLCQETGGMFKAAKVENWCYTRHLEPTWFHHKP